jgi:hypothetical protein
MSDTPENNTPAPDAPEAPAAAAQDAKPAPPWGDDFDAEKAWNLITNLRADKEKLSAREFLTDDQKTKLAEYDKLVESRKTELEKAQDAAGKVAPLEAENLRLKVAIEKGLTGDKAGLVARLQGNTLDELLADADTLLSLFPSPGATPEKPGMQPNPSQGRSASPAPSIGDQIAAAQAAGDFKTAIRLKAAQALESSDQ